MATTSKSQIVFTNKAKCRDCYRCIRACPVKAIRMEAGQAFIVEDLCIACGTCIRECPQHAKSFRNDLESARQLIQFSPKVAVSLAPSFAAVWDGWKRKRIISALRKLGFSIVSETAVGAWSVAQETADFTKAHPGQTHIATACPAVVNYVEKYRPQNIDNLVPVVSPMIAHARHIRNKWGRDVRIVFIGPCIAKKSEAERRKYQGDVDCAITFMELEEWLDRENIHLDQLEESDFDELAAGDSRLFPLVGGLTRTAALHNDLLSREIIHVSGFQDLDRLLDSVSDGVSPRLIEPLFCEHGCVNGPAIPGECNVFRNREQVIEFSRKESRGEPDKETVNIQTEFQDCRMVVTEFSEADIRKVLIETGQTGPENELNCGACGYTSCRERAIAVLRGMAEPEMCIPYMRRMTEQRGDLIIESSPNGIVILDEQLNILHMNPAFRGMFMCSAAVSGKRISYLIDPEPFEKLAADEIAMREETVEHKKYGVICHQIMYKLPDEKQYVGIFVNITKNRKNQEKIEKMRYETVWQAQELMEHQIKMAQKIAEFLGESTAKGEVLVDKLIKIAQGETNRKPSDKKLNPWDIYMSK